MQEEINETIDNLWQAHTEKFLEMAFRTDRREVLAHPDGKGEKSGDCGDTVAFFLMLQDNRINTISYAINGCINTNACANAIVEMTEGKTLEQAWQVTPERVAEYLQSLPADHFHCAELVVGALYLALADAGAMQKTPWKKMYR